MLDGIRFYMDREDTSTLGLSSEEENAAETKLVANEEEERQGSAGPWNP